MDDQGEETILFERYRIDDILGEGGQAVVLKAFDLRLNVSRALKVMLPAAASRRALRERFETEAHILASIEHPNVVRVYDVEATGPLPWFVMELVEGGTLVDRLASGPLPPHMVCHVVEQMCAGLAAAHARGVVHRDVKPGNVLVAPGGVCKLVDFGIARLEDLGRTKAGVTMGTPGFMAPEQGQDASTVDLRADVYSVGMSAYILLTGREPWEWIAGERSGVPEPLAPVLARATARKRTDRYDRVEEFAVALRAAVAQLPPDPPDATLARPFVARKTDLTALRERLHEVRSWFGPPADPTPNPATPVPARPTLQYTMSRPELPAAGDRSASTPAWLLGDPAPLPTGGFEISVDGMTRRRDPAPPTPAEAPPPLSMSERLFPNWFLGLIALAVVLGATGSSVAWWNLYQQQVAEASARARLVSTVRENLSVLSLLSQLGSDQAVLESLETALSTADNEGERLTSAIRLVEHANSEMERLAPPGSPQRRHVERPIAAMNAALSAWRTELR